MLLAVETSGTQGSIAIFAGTQVLCERVLSVSGPRHAQTLPAEVAAALADNNLQPNAIRSIAVSIGPGSFTGLRVGVTFAKTFAWLNDARLVAVDTLRAIAQQVSAEMEFVTAIADAQRSEFFMATYRWNPELHLRCAVDDVRVAGIDELPTDYPIAGPAAGKLAEVLPARFKVVDQSLWQPHAVNIGLIGQQMLNSQQFAAPDSLEPVYIRLSYAEEKRREAVPPNAFP